MRGGGAFAQPAPEMPPAAEAGEAGLNARPPIWAERDADGSIEFWGLPVGAEEALLASRRGGMAAGEGL